MVWNTKQKLPEFSKDLMLLIHKPFKNSEANIYSTEDDLDLQDPPGRAELAKPALQSSLSQNEPLGPSPTVNTSDAPADSPADSWDAMIDQLFADHSHGMGMPQY